MKILKFIPLFFILVLFQNCKNNSSKEENSVSVIDNISEKKIDIDSIIDNYAKQLSNSDFRIVDSITCVKLSTNPENYDNGIRAYGYYSVKSNLLQRKVEGDLNNDEQKDYIANYSCENCWNGIGAGNYLSNCFFLTSEKDKIVVNEQMTNDFKQKFIDEINERFGNPYFKKAQKEIMINGIEFTKIENQIAYGKFNINTEACQGSPFPCVEGTFEYDANNRTVKMLGKINDEYVDQSN